MNQMELAEYKSFVLKPRIKMVNGEWHIGNGEVWGHGKTINSAWHSYIRNKLSFALYRQF